MFTPVTLLTFQLPMGWLNSDAANMNLIFVILLTFQSPTGWLNEDCKNIPSILVTLLTSQFPMGMKVELAGGVVRRLNRAPIYEMEDIFDDIPFMVFDHKSCGFSHCLEVCGNYRDSQ